jgi:hypothetical protein
MIEATPGTCMTALLDARAGRRPDSHGALEGDGCGLYRLVFCP